MVNKGKWSSDEIEYVRMFAENPDLDTCITVAQYLDRTPGAVRMQVHKLRQEGVHTKLLDKWTEWEINALKNMNGKVTVKEQAELLGRSYGSVASKRVVLGLSNSYKGTPVGKGKEIRFLAKQGLFRKEIAEKLELNYSSLCKYIKREGICCVDDEEGRLRGFKQAMANHNQVMSWAFHKEKKYE
ncbi:hypothetical protein [Streptococcus ovis]|uniref:hypothetical protein n=1 Tax=Streptococcus ovis TaxID=82806 RepID=UPI00036AFC4B|nr:hypothetical protein [Streptococcus ovis]